MTSVQVKAMQTIFQNPELSSFLIMSFQAIWPNCPRPRHYFYSLGRDHCLVPWRRRVWNLPLDSTSRIMDPNTTESPVTRRSCSRITSPSRKSLLSWVWIEEVGFC